jgi:hypothetical protein
MIQTQFPFSENNISTPNYDASKTFNLMLIITGIGLLSAAGLYFFYIKKSDDEK